MQEFPAYEYDKWKTTEPDIDEEPELEDEEADDPGLDDGYGDY